MSLLQMLLKSMLPGFSVGSELALLVGIFKERQALATVMLVFRLLHSCVIFLGTYVIFFPIIVLLLFAT